MYEPHPLPLARGLRGRGPTPALAITIMESSMPGETVLGLVLPLFNIDLELLNVAFSESVFLIFVLRRLSSKSSL